MMNCPMVSFWAMCPFPLQKTSERISMRIPYFVLFHIVSWAPLPLDNAAHQACVTIVHKNIWKQGNIFPPNWNLDSSKLFPQDDNYHSLSFSTKTLMFEQTLHNSPHVEIFLSRSIFLRKVTLFCLRVFLCDSSANMGIYDILLGIFRLLIIIVIIIIIS